MRILLLMLAFAMGSMAQTVESRSVMLKGTSLPASCVVGERFFKTDATAGENLYLCTSTDTWTQVSGGSGASYPTDLLCKVTVATNVATFGAGASGTNPCNFQGNRITAQGTLTITSTPAAGTYYFETAGGVIYANLPGATTGLSASGITMSASTAGFTVGRAKIATITYTSGTDWDATVTDWRQPFSEAPVPAAGTLMTSSDSSGVRTLAVDAQNLYANNYLRSTSGNDTYVAGTTPATVAYSTGRCYVLNADTANTGAATVNIDSLGAKSILRRNGDALSDGDITADKPISICYDGTQFIIQGDGGGSSGVTLSGSYWYMNVNGGSGAGYSVVGTTPRFFRWVAPYNATIGKVATFISAALGSGAGITWGLYNDACSSQIAVATPYVSTGGTGSISVTFSSPPTVTAGTVYCWIIATDSATVNTLIATTASTSEGHLNTTVNRIGTCGNPNTGTGAAVAPPTSCGTETAATALHRFALLP